MRKTFVGIALLLCAGCVQVLQWDAAERQTVEAEHENAITQLEMNSAMGAIATLAEKHMLVALDNKLSKLPQIKRLALLRDQREWQRLMDRRNAESMGDGSIVPMLRYGREKSRQKNRFMELTVPEEVRQVFQSMKNAPVRFNDKVVSLVHGELDIDIPTEGRKENMPTTETIGQLQIPFCRKIIIKKDTFWIGVIEPTNFGVVSSFGEGTESNLCIWKNGENIANHLIGKRIAIRELSINGNMIKVSFLTESEEMQQKEFDCQKSNNAPILINHWTTEQVN